MTPSIYDLNTPQGLREVVGAMFTGFNYRFYTEGETRAQLVGAYQKLLAIIHRLPKGADYNEWMGALREELGKTESTMEWWLLGLGKKTADNLGIKGSEERLEFLEQIGKHLLAISEKQGGPDFEDSMLMLWAGAATLTIRGSRKSTVGKRLEKVFMRAGLTILGLTEGSDFWLGMHADAEVQREVDCEIATRRGRMRVEVGLIEAGNPEVIMDKVTRVGSGGMVIFDRLGPKSNAPQLAINNQVALIPIRNNRPLCSIHEHLSKLIGKPLTKPPSAPDDIKAVVKALPDDIFVRGII